MNTSQDESGRFDWWCSRMLGGRTNHWGRYSFRNGPYDFKPHARDGLGFDWPLSHEELAPYYDKVEMLIGVCQRIVNGTQAMTIYEPLRILARNAADLAVRMAQRKVVVAPQTVNNGAIDVPSVLADVVTVTKDNMLETVIADGLHSFDDVYRGVPEKLRPAREGGLAGR